MNQKAKHSTIYFESGLHKALSGDRDDLAVFDERAEEPTMTYEELLENLKAYGKI